MRPEYLTISEVVRYSSSDPAWVAENAEYIVAQLIKTIEKEEDKKKTVIGLAKDLLSVLEEDDDDRIAKAIESLEAFIHEENDE